MASPIEALAAGDAAAVTVSDSTVVAFDAVYVGVTGNVAVRTVRGSTVTFVGVPAGSILPVKCDRVMSTNTTATSLVGLKY
ncbi:spike base protein, RCAP_Rcc01079 family [Mesorhizobium wenxiniae]|uniref:Uncharacterized protein n=1 Tax=Mesorhizobium wenxiniae TaxID=2014805 RepID=A0A271KG88_9HYPH|nr:hypothetical protein [Mesorhizobium wenxiniae]PAP93999.1 hypothetical protein CIT31_16665 [Mesorhizobium wenxiniae]